MDAISRNQLRDYFRDTITPEQTEKLIFAIENPGKDDGLIASVIRIEVARRVKETFKCPADVLDLNPFEYARVMRLLETVENPGAWTQDDLLLLERIIVRRILADTPPKVHRSGFGFFAIVGISTLVYFVISVVLSILYRR